MLEMTKVFKKTAGGSLVERPPKFSCNSKFLLAISGTCVKVFSCLSGDCVQELKHDSQVVGLQVLKTDENDCITCTENGLVQKWNFGTGVCEKLKELDMGSIIEFQTDPEALHYFIATKPSNTDAYTITCINVAKSSRFVLVKGAHLPIFSINISRKYIAGIFKGLVVSSFKKSLTMSHALNNKIVCVACHPVEDLVATGDSKGMIFIWYQPLKTNPARTKLHWHTLPVKSLCFSSEGSYLYSGGHESVLVFWSLCGNFEQSFLPRLGMPIIHLVGSSSNYLAASQNDNGILIIDPHKIIRQHIQGLTYCAQFCNKKRKVLPAGMLWDPRSKSIVMNGKIGHLQFFSPHIDKQLFNLDVVQSNYKTEERNKDIINIDVDKAVLSECNTWLVTVETRDDSNTCLEVRLKFWMYCNKAQSFVLNTCVEYPHEGQVLGLTMWGSKDQDDLLLVSVSDEGCFKVWVYMLDSGPAKINSWTNAFTGRYKDYCPYSAGFSEDGSLLVVSFEHVLTLWDTETFDVPNTLIKPYFKSKIKTFILGLGNASHLLVEGTEDKLSCWNLLTLTLTWSVDLELVLLVRNPYSPVFAAITADKVLMMTPSSNKPLETIMMHSQVMCGVFIPDKNEKNYLLYVMNDHQELLLLTSPTQSDGTTRRTVASNTPISLFDSVFPKNKVSDAESLQPKPFLSTGTVGSKLFNELMDVPAYTIDSPRNILKEFLAVLLTSQSVSNTEKTNKTNGIKQVNGTIGVPDYIAPEDKFPRQNFNLDDVKCIDLSTSLKIKDIF